MVIVRTHGNCARWTERTQTQVCCQPDLLPACWHMQDGDASKFKCWQPREVERRLKMVELVGEFYDGDFKHPICAEARCSDGSKRTVETSRLMQARLAGWRCDYYRYEEGGIGYCRQTWRGAPLEIVVMEPVKG